MSSQTINGLKLLLWKNFTIKFRHKLGLFIELAIPLAFCSIFLLLRHVSRQDFHRQPTIFNPVDIKSISFSESYGFDRTILAYTPQNEITDKIAARAAKQLKLNHVGFNNSGHMESYMIAKNIFFGVNFININEQLTTNDLDFELRIPPNIPKITQIVGWDTNVFHIPKYSNEPFDSAGWYSDVGGEFGYIQTGIAKVQLIVSNAIIETLRNVDLPDIVMQRFPYPSYMEDPILILLDNVLVVVVVASFAHSVAQTVKRITSERATHLTETMKIMGLKTLHHWVSWFILTYLFAFVIIVILLITLKVPIVNGTAILPASSFGVLLVFLLCYGVPVVTFTFLVSTLFEKPVVGGAMASVLFFVAYIPYELLKHELLAPSTVVGTILSLFLNTGMGLGFQSILQWEATTEGAQFSNLFSSAAGSPVSVGLASLMLLLDGALYMLLALYVEKVWPGKHGVKHKWNFFFVKSKDFSNSVQHHSDECKNIDPNRFEEDPANANKKVGIRIVNLRKEFDDKTAVDGLSMDMYENEITVLLGHNGAGKTTTISMITGFLMPSGGKIEVNGIDTSANMDAIRKNLGICPQHNTLFDELTVQEHITFYSRLKGLNPSHIKDEITKYLRLLQLEDKRNEFASTLSGGMKRKLSLGVALCGGSKVVLCDEPSSGMDPEARRALWNLLETEKQGRTILLTTHFMDEADVLGDKIVILSGGELTCSGTPFFLKKKFGTGYQLICNKTSGCHPENVTALIQKYVPNATVKSNVGTELSYSLPESDVARFEHLLTDLEASQSNLGLTGYGISMTTLEDVFMQTGSELHKDDQQNTSDESAPVSLDIRQGTESLIYKQRYRYQWEAMFLKKFLFMKRNWCVPLLQIFLPLMFLCFVLQNTSFGMPYSMPPLKVKLDNYGRTNTLLSGSTNSTITIAYRKIFEGVESKHKLIPIGTDMIDAIVDLNRKASTFDEEDDYVVGATIAKDKLTAWFNHEIMHTVPTSLNLMQNAVAKAVLGDIYNMQVTIHPLPYSIDSQNKRSKDLTTAGYQMAINLSFSMPLISAMFAICIVRERVSKAKLLQFASGVPSFTYWFSHLLMDLLVYVVIAIGIMILCVLFQVEQFQSAEALGALIISFLLYGLASLPFTYLLSFAFDSAETAVSRIYILNLIAGMVLLMGIFIMRIFAENQNHIDLARGFFLLLPSYGLSEAIYNEGTHYMLQKACTVAPDQFESNQSILLAIAVLISKCPGSVFAWNYPGLGATLFALAASGVVYFTILVLLEIYKRKVQNLNNICRPERPKLGENVDDDVQAEKDRVENMGQEHIKQQTLVMRRLTKFYKRFCAVKNLSVAVKHGECFGLLGVNGAGKTSAFKMLIGDESISYGEVFIEGLNAQTDMPQIYEMIGYCPQFDALLLEMTGYELLKIFCLIHGIPKYTIPHLIERLAIDLAFEKYLFRRVESYSGGNRRKLNTAISLLGDPHIVYLDEPTSGIDPASRRKLWDMICYLRNSGKGIILTSHSMEECEALCTRVAIMVNGEFKCLGSTQHLKSKFSKTISLTVKLKKIESSGSGEVTSDEDELKRREDRIVAFMQEKFPGSQIIDSRLRLLTFEIPLKIMPYSKIFGLMEEHRIPLMIEDYSLTQATLEQIFLQFARLQRTNEETPKKKRGAEEHV